VWFRVERDTPRVHFSNRVLVRVPVASNSDAGSGERRRITKRIVKKDQQMIDAACKCVSTLARLD
jgi:hypothetical protein